MREADVDGFGAWLPGWRHFFAWSGRIGRRPFFGGYIALSFMMGAIGMIGIGLLVAFDASFRATGILLFALLAGSGLPLSALIAQRAHDIGLTAFIPLALFLVLGAPMMAFVDFSFGVFGYGLARVAHAAGLDDEGLFPFVVIGNGLWMLFALFLFLKKGQPLSNRFGPPPAQT
jgi:uncharacterized membrane protein YhaH (DUF805 family)